MEPFIEYGLEKGGPPILAALAVFGFFYWRFHDLHQNAVARERWAAKLASDNYATRYRSLLRGLLDWFDARLSPEFPADTALPKTEVGRAWSAGLLDICLLLSVAYPILSVVAVWTITGEAGRLATLKIIPAEPHWWLRYAPIGLIAFSISAAIRSGRAISPSPKIAYLFVSVGLLVASVLIVGRADTGLLMVAIAVAVSYSVAVSHLVGGAFPGVHSVVLASAGAVIVVGTLTTAGAFSGAVALALVMAGTVTQEQAGKRFNRPTLALAIYVIALFCATLVVVMRFDILPYGEFAIIFLFLGFLPLLNAVADFISTGLTRFWLRAGIQGNLVWNAARDAVAAVVILIGLGMALIATVAFVRPRDGQPLFDLAALFADLRGPAAADYYWLYFCFFSTLLPTALHLAVGCLGLFTLLSSRLGRPIAEGLRAGAEDSDRGKMASLSLAVCATAAVVAPFLIIRYGLLWFGRPILDGLLFIFENFARTIGAV